MNSQTSVSPAEGSSKHELSQLSARLTSEHRVQHQPVSISGHTKVTGDLKGLGNLSAVLVGSVK